MSERRSASIPAIEMPSSSSGRTSENTSPTRTVRKNSSVEYESTQAANTSSNHSAPSSAAVQRASSVTKAATANNDSSSDTYRDRRQRLGQNAPQWPTSPRLKSPPPVSNYRPIAGRRAETEQNQSHTTMRRLAPVSTMELGAVMQVSHDALKESSISQSNTRPSARGASAQASGLETVAENSVPSTSSMRLMPTQEENSKMQTPPVEHKSDAIVEPPANKDVTSTTAAETMSRLVPERAETAPSSRATSASRAGSTNLAKRSLTSLTAKNKPAVEPLRTITLETEPVNSTPQLITDRGRDGGSVRTKPSTETIRPRKEKKKPTRKAPSLHAGINSSKADIFEAKVASAVDEADSSDSDETFVYESNPPEPRQARHHSRTPSANSLASQNDHYGARGKHGVRSNSTVTGGKKSMKFSNSIYGAQLEAESAGDGRNSTRTTNSTPRHHHIGRHGRNGHTSIIDNESPFTQATRGTSPRTSITRISRPSSPRTSNGRLHLNRKSVVAGYEPYDDGADDERAPLIGSVRINRNRHARRPNSSHLRALQFADDEDSGCWPRFGGCCLLGFITMLICIGVAVFVVVLSRGLMDVEIVHVQNVLASEQEIMLDLRVRAINPNLFTITVSDLDVNIFAESPYVGTTTEWEKYSHLHKKSFSKRRRQRTAPEWHRDSFWFPPSHPDKGIDEGTDPIDDPEPGSQKMLLGRIFAFDSPLSFDPSPIRHNPTASVGEIRLRKPGNATEIGGSERWERVLQHPFSLIVRGVLKYQLPLSSYTRSAKVGSRVMVSPGGDSTPSVENS